jgi:hypothetical protein
MEVVIGDVEAALVRKKPAKVLICWNTADKDRHR